MGRGGSKGGSSRGGASSRPSSSSSHSSPAPKPTPPPAQKQAPAPTPAAATPTSTAPRSTTTPTKPAPPPQQQTRAASTTAHAPARTQPHAQQQRSGAGTLLRSAMIGMGVGLLTSFGLHALFGNREGRALDRTDVIAAITGAGATLGTATLVKNRALLRRQPLLPPNAPVFRPSFQYILWSVVGALGGIVVNSLRIESNKVNELPPPPAEFEGTANKWGDEAPATA